MNYFSISFVYSSSKRGQKFANVKKSCCMQSIQMTIIMGWGCKVAQILVLQFCKACNEGTGLWKPLRDYHDRTVSDHIVLFAFLIQLLKLVFGFYCIWFYFCKFLIPLFNWRSRFFPRNADLKLFVFLARFYLFGFKLLLAVYLAENFKF